MKLGRNDLCYCESGKKYKKCCLNKELASKYLSVIELDEDMNIRDIVMNKLRDMVDMLCQYRVANKKDLDKLIQETVEFVIHIIAPGQSFIGNYEDKAPQNVLNHFTRNDINLICELCMSFKMEYLMLTAATVPDYGMMKIMAIATLKILEEGMNESSNLQMVSINYYGEDELVDYKLTYSNKPSKIMYWANEVSRDKI